MVIHSINLFILVIITVPKRLFALLQTKSHSLCF